RPDHEKRYLIDTSRNVVLSVEQRSRGKVSSTTRFDGFVEVAGCWWARRVETLDDKGQRLTLATQTITELLADDFATRMTQELAGQGKVLSLRQPLPGAAEAKAAVAAGKSTFDDAAVLTLHFAATQQWARALEHLQQCERLAAGKLGLRWLRDAFLLASRRHEELRQRLLDEAGAIATATDADTLANDYFLAEVLTRQAQQVMETNETLRLPARLQPLHQPQPEHVQARQPWRSRRVPPLQQAGQSAQALSLSQDLAVAYRQDQNLQFHYAQNLAGAGDFDAAYAWLNRVLVPEA